MENISKNIRLITAPNPSPMTFKGTNTYIVGSSKDICIIDPGPNNEEHYSKLKTLLKKENASHILVTHSHLDHSPLATRISEEFSIPIYAHGELKDARSKLMKKILESSYDVGGFEGLDMNFQPDFYLKTAHKNRNINLINGPDIVVLNTSTEPLTISLKSSVNWMKVSPSVTIQSGESKTIQATFDKDKISGLKPKRRRIGWNGKAQNHNGTITVSGGGETVTFQARMYKERNGK